MATPKNIQKLSITKEYTGSTVADRIQGDVRKLAEILHNNPFVLGRGKSVAFVANVRKIVSHGLGRPAAFYVVRGNYAGNGLFPILIEDASQAGLDPNNQIAITANVNCTVDLWAYPRVSAKTPD